jgi:hypothetical protein
MIIDIKTRNLTTQDFLDAGKIKNPKDRSFFLISKYFEIPLEEINDMPYPIISHLYNILMDDIYNMENVTHIEYSLGKDQIEDKIINRFEILDL